MRSRWLSSEMARGVVGFGMMPEHDAARRRPVARVKNGWKYSRFDSFCFLFLSIHFYICGSRFYIYGNRNEISPSVSEKSRFYMELTRIYSVFHPVFNLHKICLKIDMFKNIPITKYAC